MADREPKNNTEPGRSAVSYGKGAYDVECNEMRDRTKADVAVLVILGGERGSNFSITAIPDPGAVRQVPRVLRQIADNVDKFLAAQSS